MQNVLDLPSSGWNVRSNSSPSRIRIASVAMRPLVVLPPPDSYWQLAQWQCTTPSNGPVT